ncbi:unnamed protein product [Paramecium sonneborni]|uniref:Uncharacterized protein n=1 Tax=Paramecium sonneborni TaxID=65129 RepID=A0A8S1K6Q4_9CILI|nr:unnamed protein product [Paramecium sonneborni]
MERLQNTRSLKGIIDKAEFQNDKIIYELEYDKFDIMQ